MTYVSTFLCMANESEAYSHSNLEKNLGDGSLFCDSYQLTQIYSKRQKILLTRLELIWNLPLSSKI